MESAKDTWLDGLVRHPIFQLSNAEKQNVQKLNSNKTRSNSQVADFVLQHHNNIIAIRDTDLFVAVGSQIRVLNLTYCKNTWSKLEQESIEREDTLLTDSWIPAVPYKILDTPEIDFDIESLTPNQNGRLLTVKGSNKLVVVCLPRQGFSDFSDHIAQKKVDCRTLLIGSEFYNTHKAEIFKTEWHPLSETRTHIVVLSSDNFLRIFDISSDIEKPEQSFDLSLTGKVKNQDENVVSFSLGGVSKVHSGWEPFTVFYSTENGHIYALCPVIPYKSSVLRSHIDTISSISRAKFKHSKDTASNETKHSSKAFELQCSWISALLESAKAARRPASNSVDCDKLILSSDSTQSKYPVQKQGPFAVGRCRTLKAGSQVTDILFTNLKSINVISLAFTTGVIHNYILGSDIDAQWEIPTEKKIGTFGKSSTDVQSLLTASLYESLDLKSPAVSKHQSLVLIRDPLHEETYFVYHSSGVHVLSMKPWAEKLDKINVAFETDDQQATDDLNSLLNSNIKSDVRLLIDSSPMSSGYVPIIGLSIVSDVFLSYSILAITNDYRLVVKDMYIPKNASPLKGSQSAVKAQLGKIAEDDKSNGNYESILPLPAFQVPAQSESLYKISKVVIPVDKNGSKEIIITEETLRFFTKSAESIRSEINEIKTAAAKTNSRLEIQQKEFKLQVQFLHGLYDKLQKIKSDELEKKFKELAEKHIKLRLRFDEKLSILKKKSRAELSPEEQDWISKLEKLSNKVSGDSGYASKVKEIQAQVQQLKDQTKKVYKPRPSNISPLQLKTILRTVTEQSNAIEDVKERVQELETKVTSTAA